MKEFEWFEWFKWFEWFGPSPIEPFNSACGSVNLPRGGEEQVPVHDIRLLAFHEMSIGYILRDVGFVLEGPGDGRRVVGA